MARRQFNVFSLSFLDVMACGLGAIVLFYMIITAQVATRAAVVSVDLQSETDKLEEQVLEGRKNLIRARNVLESKQQEQVATEGEARRLQEMLEQLLEELATYENDSAASIESIEKLRSDIERLEKAKRQLAAKSSDTAPQTGQQIRAFGEGGTRQYLTGMQMGGERVLILVDTSTSMLARTYVNVVRFRSMSDELKVKAPKWQQAMDTVDWLTTQLQSGNKFQVYSFSEDVHSVLEGTDGTWLDVSKEDLDRTVEEMRAIVPDKGTSLYNAFKAVKDMDPLPDNIYLLTDGLPTQGKTIPAAAELVKARQRVDFFNKAVKELPKKIPVNILLFPMDGDPDAAILFWQLALSTRGSFLSPSRDWP